MMTKERAIQLLRMEMLGDSEEMELAKQMGALALQNQDTPVAYYLIKPHTLTDLEKINALTRKQYTEDEVRIYTIILATNEIDRDYERFTKAALMEIGEQSIGKSVISYISPNKNIQGKVFETWIEKNEGQFTSDNYQSYTLKAKVYIPRCDANKSLIKEIDSGKRKEISVSCSVNKTKCSICGEDIRSGKCNHIAGNVYNDKLCIRHLINITDVYEFVFVEPAN